MTCCAKREHSCCERIVIRAQAAEAWQQTMMQVDDSPTSKFPTGLRRKHSHITSQNDVVSLVLINDLHHIRVVSRSVLATDIFERDSKLIGEWFAHSSVSDDHHWIRTNHSCLNRFQYCPQWRFKTRHTDSQVGTRRTFIWTPNSNLQPLLIGNFCHRYLDGCQLIRVNVNTTHHRKQSRFVMIIHLNFSDVRTARRDVVNDWVGQAHVVWPNSRDYDFHPQKFN